MEKRIKYKDKPFIIKLFIAFAIIFPLCADAYINSFYPTPFDYLKEEENEYKIKKAIVEEYIGNVAIIIYISKEDDLVVSSFIKRTFGWKRANCIRYFNMIQFSKTEPIPFKELIDAFPDSYFIISKSKEQKIQMLYGITRYPNISSITVDEKEAIIKEVEAKAENIKFWYIISDDELTENMRVNYK